MLKPNFTLPLLAAIMFTCSSCEFLGNVFKAGVWTGLLIVAVIVALLIWLISRFRK